MSAGARAARRRPRDGPPRAAAGLDAEPDLRVVAEAGDGAEALELRPRAPVDLAILDVSMPRLTGLQAAAGARAVRPDVRVLMLSMHDNEQYLFEALRAGASGYVLKSAADRDLVEACRAALRGEPFLYPSGIAALIRDFLDRARDGDDAAARPADAARARGGQADRRGAHGRARSPQLLGSAAQDRRAPPRERAGQARDARPRRADALRDPARPRRAVGESGGFPPPIGRRARMVDAARARQAVGGAPRPDPVRPPPITCPAQEREALGAQRAAAPALERCDGRRGASTSRGSARSRTAASLGLADRGARRRRRRRGCAASTRARLPRAAARPAAARHAAASWSVLGAGQEVLCMTLADRDLRRRARR